MRREICVSKSIGLACSGKEIYHFCFVLLCIRGQISSTSSLGGLYSEGRFNGGFFVLRFWGGLYFGRALYMKGLFSEFYGIHIQILHTDLHPVPLQSIFHLVIISLILITFSLHGVLISLGEK